MAQNFPENRYLISIVEPLINGRRQSEEVEIYEKLDAITHHLDMEIWQASNVEHMRYVGSFPLRFEGTMQVHTLDEIIEKVSQIVADN